MVKYTNENVISSYQHVYMIYFEAFEKQYSELSYSCRPAFPANMC